jgi:hypothetical protein
MRHQIPAVLFVSAAIYAISLMTFGAPVRVHLLDAAGMLFAFTVPNLVLVNVTHRLLALTIALVLHALATLAWFFFLPLVVVKAEPSAAGATSLLAFSLVAFGSHAGFVNLVTRGIAFCALQRRYDGAASAVID